MSCAETAELIDLPFGLWTRVGRRKHKFNRIRLWRKCALPCGHMWAHWRHVANTTEPSVCGGDAVLYQITLTTCSSRNCLVYRNSKNNNCKHTFHGLDSDLLLHLVTRSNKTRVKHSPELPCTANRLTCSNCSLWSPYGTGQTIIFLPRDFYLSSSFFFLFSSPNLSGRRLDAYHTTTHGVALVRI